MIKWVLIAKVVELIGYTDDAIRAKIKNGVWLNGVHWLKAPDGRIMFNLEAIQRWIEGKAYGYEAARVSRSTSSTVASDAGKR